MIHNQFFGCHILKVLLDQCLEFFYHLTLNLRIGSFEVLLESGILSVGKQACLILTVKLQEVFSLIVGVEAVLEGGGPGEAVGGVEQVDTVGDVWTAAARTL